MKKRCTLIYFFAVIFWVCELDAQSKVTGKVKDRNGEALIGVTILEDGTSNGTSTEFEGSYSITVSNVNASLSFSYVGYQLVRRNVDDSPEVNVILFEDAKMLD